MIILELISKLLETFEQEKRKSPTDRALVFWYDPEAEDRDFDTIRQQLEQHHIQVWLLNKNNVFQTKVVIEEEQTDQSFLIYAPFAKPEPENNYLIDILLYSAEFKADETALLATELGLDQPFAYPFIQEYRKFFRDKRRKEKFKKLLPARVSEDVLKRCIYAVLANVNALDMPHIMQAVFKDGLIDEENETLQRINRFANLEAFYKDVYEYFGLKSDQGYSLQEVFKTIVYYHAVMTIEQLADELPACHSSVPNTCRLFLEDQLQDSGARETLKPLLQNIESEWGVYALLNSLPIEELVKCTTFPVAVHLFLDRIIDQLQHETTMDHRWKEFIETSRSSYWAQDEQLSYQYQFLRYAVDLMTYKHRVSEAKYLNSGKDWFKAYVEHDYKVDQLYRQLMTVYREAGMPENLSGLKDQLTSWYEQEFLTRLARYTDQIIAEHLADSWPIPKVTQQYHFYHTYIDPLVKKTSERIFVIISDALRYEAGVELYEQLKYRLNAQVEINAMQTSLPSYTQLGMASLLPGKLTDIDENGHVYVNGISSSGLDNRNRILQQTEPDAIALNLDDLIQKGKEEGLALIKGKRVVYLYHNLIDATGDKQSTERYTFKDVKAAIKELQQAVQKITGTWAGKRIFITADHGFLYQESAVDSDQKTMRINGTIYDSNRRFAIGKHLEEVPGSQRISLSYLGLEIEALIARGLNRFTAGGGMKFVHGGAMPQEAIIPVIHYREIWGQARKKEEQRVDIRVSLRSKVITNYQVNVQFFQEQKASIEYRPRHIRAAFYKNGERISNEVTLVFDSEKEAAERQTNVLFSLVEDRYPLGETCVLRMEDVTGSNTTLYKEEPFELRLYDV